MKKRVLVLGGTGAMGIYLVPYLAEMGYAVHSGPRWTIVRTSREFVI